MWTIAVLVGVVAVARAQPEGELDDAQAREHYRRARSYHDAGEYERAATQYLAAYELSKRPALLFNAAQAYRLHGNKARAVELYRDYLVLVPDGEVADSAREFVARLEQELAQERAELEAREQELERERMADERRQIEESKRRAREREIVYRRTLAQQRRKDAELAAKRARLARWPTIRNRNELSFLRVEVTAEVATSMEVQTSALAKEQAGDAAASDPEALGDELAFWRSRYVVAPAVTALVARHLEIGFRVPIVLAQSQELRLDGRSRADSRTVLDGVLPTGGFDAQDPGGPGFTSGDLMFRGGGRSGVDQVYLRAAWTPKPRLVNQARWSLGAELRAAVGAPMLFDRDDPDAETSVGHGVHELRGFGWFAKRAGAVDVRVGAWWQTPVGTLEDSKFQDPGFGARSAGPPDHRGADLSVVFPVWSRLEIERRLAVRLEVFIEQTTGGRDYSELWEVFQFGGDAGENGPLVIDSNPVVAGLQAADHPGVSRVDGYFSGGAGLAVELDVGAVHAVVAGRFGVRQEHFITGERAGVDLPTCGGGNSPPDCEFGNNNTVDPGTSEVNPLHVPIIDGTGFRYAVSGGTDLDLSLQLAWLY